MRHAPFSDAAQEVSAESGYRPRDGRSRLDRGRNAAASIVALLVLVSRSTRCIPEVC